MHNNNLFGKGGQSSTRNDIHVNISQEQFESSPSEADKNMDTEGYEQSKRDTMGSNINIVGGGDVKGLSPMGLRNIENQIHFYNSKVKNRITEKDINQKKIIACSNKNTLRKIAGGAPLDYE